MKREWISWEITHHAIKVKFVSSLFPKMKLMYNKSFTFSLLQEGAGVPGIRRSVPRTIKVRVGVGCGVVE